jgi:hypothetical protein
MKETKAYYDRIRRIGMRHEIEKLRLQITATPTGEARRPLYASARRLKKILARASKIAH